MLITLGIAGIIIASGIAPLLYTVRVLANARDDFYTANLERSVFNRMTRDMREIAVLNSSGQVRVIEGDMSVDGKNDLLILWTTTPSYSMLPLGTVAYGLSMNTVTTEEMKPGLYRWVTSSDLRSGDISFADLKPEDATLLIPDLKGVSMSCMRDIEWEEIYQGPLPKAYMVTFEYDDRKKTYETWFPNF